MYTVIAVIIIVLYVWLIWVCFGPIGALGVAPFSDSFESLNMNQIASNQLGQKLLVNPFLYPYSAYQTTPLFSDTLDRDQDLYGNIIQNFYDDK
jgi:hypothetical protein